MGEEMKEKVVVLRELQRAIIYTNELSKQAMEGHVSRAFTVYSVHEGARLTYRSIRVVYLHDVSTIMIGVEGADQE
jgi:hypothetical protein